MLQNLHEFGFIENFDTHKIIYFTAIDHLYKNCIELLQNYGIERDESEEETEKFKELLIKSLSLVLLHTQEFISKLDQHQYWDGFDRKSWAKSMSTYILTQAQNEGILP